MVTRYIVCSTLAFRRVFENIRKDYTVHLWFKFYNQEDGYAMDGPLSLTWSYILMVKVEDYTVQKHRSKSDQLYVDYIINPWKENLVDLVQWLK